jgi:hypothetical protein
VAGEVRGYDDNRLDTIRAHEPLRFVEATWSRDDVEVARLLEALDVVNTLRRRVLVDDGSGNVIDVQIQTVPEKNQEDDRHQERDPEHERVA